MFKTIFKREWFSISFGIAFEYEFTRDQTQTRYYEQDPELFRNQALQASFKKKCP